MKITIISFFFLLFCFGSFSQTNDDRVKLTITENGKRTIFFAENTSQDTLRAFLILKPVGYRRSSSRPILKDIPPKTKVAMTTIIETSNVPSSYTYQFIIDEKRINLDDIRKKSSKDISKLIENRLVIFYEGDCEKCVLLSDALKKNRIKHRVFDINQDQKLYDQFVKFIRNRFPDKTEFNLPIIWNKNKAVFGYDNLDLMLNKFSN
ncbi:MAG: hypothetical protein L3J09_04555 [Flavobacteriaceae bacterium]|nr:hypothetical protein [Flavobacteriaceae bacterium]